MLQFLQRPERLCDQGKIISFNISFKYKANISFNYNDNRQTFLIMNLRNTVEKTINKWNKPDDEIQSTK